MKARINRLAARTGAALAVVALCATPSVHAGVNPGATPSGNTQDGIDRRWSDFDNDGFADLAIGAPFEDAAEIDAGVVWVMYGGPNGLDDSRNQLWYQDNPGVGDSAQEGDHFGWSLTTGRFDTDNYEDLAIGVPHEDNEASGLVDSGGYNILYGSADGLMADSRQPFRTHFAPGSNAEYGFALEAADVDDDALDELIVGAPGEDAVYGPNDRLLDPDGDFYGTYIFSECNVSAGARYGSALAVGYFESSTHAEIAVGAPLDDVPIGGGIIAADAGSVCIITVGQGTTLVRQSHEIAGTAKTADHFGETLAAGRLNADPYDDLAIGVPLKDVAGVRNAGLVVVVSAAGDGSGLLTGSATLLSLNSTNMPTDPKKGDRLGQALAIVDLGGPTLPDLVMGIPFQEVGGVTDAGAVIVRYSGRPTSETERWTQATTNVEDTPQAGDHFGMALYGADFDDDGPGDLVVGVPDEDIGNFVDTGALNVIYGTTAGGLSAAGDQFWHQDIAGIKGINESGDRFGLRLP